MVCRRYDHDLRPRTPQLGIPNLPDQTYVTILGYGFGLVRGGTEAHIHAQLWKTTKDGLIGYGCDGGDECEVTYAACCSYKNGIRQRCLLGKGDETWLMVSSSR